MDKLVCAVPAKQGSLLVFPSRASAANYIYKHGMWKDHSQPDHRQMDETKIKRRLASLLNKPEQQAVNGPWPVWLEVSAEEANSGKSLSEVANAKRARIGRLRALREMDPATLSDDTLNKVYELVAGDKEQAKG